MLVIGILFASAGICLKFVILSRTRRQLIEEIGDGMTWMAAWRKYGWYRSEDIAWLLLLAVGVVLMSWAFAVS